MGCWGLGVGSTAALRLGAWGAGDAGVGVWVWGRRLRGVCVARVFHVKHDVYRVAGGRRRRRYLVLKGGGRKGLSTKTDKTSLPYKTPWNFYREGMKLPVFACICLKLSVCTCVYSSGVREGGLLDLFHEVSLGTRAHELVADFAVTEHQEGRDGTYAVLGGA